MSEAAGGACTAAEVTSWLAGRDDVVVQTAAEGDGTPEVAWGDTFFHVSPDGRIPATQPFATIVTKDYPGEGTGLDRPDAFRVNVGVGRETFDRLVPVASDAAGPAGDDVLAPHPTYGVAHWLSVVNPGPRTGATLRALLEDAHVRAAARVARRDRPG